MPHLSIRRKPLLLTFNFTNAFLLSTQKRRTWRLGNQRRLVLRLEWDTLWPVCGLTPVTSHTLDMIPYPLIWFIFNQMESKKANNKPAVGLLQGAVLPNR